MEITVTQFVRPNGRQRQETIENMPEDLKPYLDAIKKADCRLTAEVIFGQVSFCIEHEEGDFDIELCANGPLPDGRAGTRVGLETLIRRFDTKKFKKWLRAVPA